MLFVIIPIEGWVNSWLPTGQTGFVAEKIYPNIKHVVAIFIKIPLMLPVAGISYEIIKFAGKHAGKQAGDRQADRQDRQAGRQDTDRHPCARTLG